MLAPQHTARTGIRYRRQAIYRAGTDCKFIASLNTANEASLCRLGFGPFDKMVQRSFG